MAEKRQELYERIVANIAKKGEFSGKLTDIKKVQFKKYLQTLERLLSVRSALSEQRHENIVVHSEVYEMATCKKIAGEQIASYTEKYQSTVEEGTSEPENELFEMMDTFSEMARELAEKYDELDKIANPEYVKQKLAEMQKTHELLQEEIVDLKYQLQDLEQRYSQDTVENVQNVSGVFTKGEITGDLDVNRKKLRSTLKTYNELKLVITEKIAEISN